MTGDGTGSLGVTALLDELLANQNDQPGDDTDAQQPLAFIPPGRGNDDAMNQQVQALSTEVDDCLASLDTFNQDRKAQNEKLQKELEAKYGFSYEEALAFEPGNIGGSADEEDEAQALRDDELTKRYLGITEQSQREGDRARIAAMVVAPACPVFTADASRQQDEARIAKLRAEVEEMKHRGETGEAAYQMPAVTALENDDFNKHLSAMSELNDWRAEVDAALGLPDAELTGAYSAEGLESMENQLADARIRGNQMDGELCSAKTRIDAELNDLETLLSECTAIQEKLAAGPG